MRAGASGLAGERWVCSSFIPRCVPSGHESSLFIVGHVRRVEQMGGLQSGYTQPQKIGTQGGDTRITSILCTDKPLSW